MLFPDAKILKINLSNGKIETNTLDGKTYRLYPGGSALGVYLLVNNMKPQIDPLSPDNVLIFTVSPLTGLPIGGLSRSVVTTKSPLTGAIGDSQAGGFFPAYLKGNGYDAVMFTGKSEKPVYLYIDGENIQLRDATHLWGRNTGDSEESIKNELGKDVEIAQIGPAGENLVNYACIINMCSRAHGRNGTGAVMGSKNLKAVVIKKTKGQKPYDIEGFNKLSRDAAQRIKNNPFVEGLGEHGTDVDFEAFSDEGCLPTRNWTSGYFPEGANALTGTTISEKILIERDTCYGCAIRCKRVVSIPGVVDPKYGGPEYETCATFGSYCGITDLETVALASQMCNMYGLDTISCGATIAFAMECYEKGLLNDENTDGLKLEFGNKDIIATLIKKIANREGIGELLSLGSSKAAEIIGKGAIELSMTVKGQELPAHMPQFKPSVGLIYAVNPFGADHQSSEHDPFLMMPKDSLVKLRLGQLGVWRDYEDSFALDDEKIRYAFDTQCYFSILDTLCLCQFVWGPAWELYGPTELIELCKTGIGWETSIFELMRIGERRINMMRHFNEKEGFTKKDDVLPDRIFEPFKDGPAKGVYLDKAEFEEAKELYYEFAGWNLETGNPKEATLRKLSIGWLKKTYI